jgi:hypothetical protein
MRSGIPGWYWTSDHPRGYYGWWVKDEYNVKAGKGGYMVMADPNNLEKQPPTYDEAKKLGLSPLHERRVVREENELYPKTLAPYITRAERKFLKSIGVEVPVYPHTLKHGG